MTGATPGGDVHSIRWEIPKKYNGKPLSVFIEANVSFDYNEFYVKDEDSPGYSDFNGQPSMVWRTVFPLDDAPRI